MTPTSPAFAHRQAIPRRHTCKGADAPPGLGRPVEAQLWRRMAGHLLAPAEPIGTCQKQR